MNLLQVEVSPFSETSSVQIHISLLQPWQNFFKFFKKKVRSFSNFKKGSRLLIHPIPFWTLQFYVVEIFLFHKDIYIEDPFIVVFFYENLT